MESVDYLDTLRVGDARDLSFIPSNAVDLTITSPPYWNAIDYRSHVTSSALNYRNRKSTGSYNEYLDFLVDSFREVYRVSKDGAFVCVVIGTVLENGRHIPLPFDFLRVVLPLGYEFYQDIIWHKCTAGIRRAGTFIQHPFPGYYRPNIMTEYILVLRKPGPPIYKGRSAEEREANRFPIDSLFTHDIANNLWNIPPVPPNVVDHPCPFPEEIADRLVRLYSYKGDLVLDPFMGSGTTLKVAHLLERHYVGVDIEPKYVDIAKLRLKEKSCLRPQQIILEYRKIAPGETIPAKNPKQRRYRRPPEPDELPLLQFLDLE